ncbi:MAG: hypothetical protein JWN25_1168 [Verrucomicrobiales bacterium]|nr:hypothetical protein [Verrucomicrobiales bacterium]
MRAGKFEENFVVVFVDKVSEQKFGEIPLDRALFADAVERLAEAKAKAVVFKFFFDQSKKEETDRRLGRSFTNLPVILEACLREEPRPNVLPSRFFMVDVQGPGSSLAARGWIPTPMILEHANDLGFVDASTSVIPMHEPYMGKQVKSLWLCCVEAATGQTAKIEPGRKVAFGGKSASINTDDEVTVDLPDPAKISYIPFHLILDKTAPPGAIAGKVVILGYDGPNIHDFPTKYGKVKAHRLFVACLKGFYDDLK